ncbi:hypothetical protein ACFX1Q_037283 [Malus domestica]
MGWHGSQGHAELFIEVIVIQLPSKIQDHLLKVSSGDQREEPMAAIGLQSSATMATVLDSVIFPRSSALPSSTAPSRINPRSSKCLLSVMQHSNHLS